jgi:muramoyltetrapeptide carboxypeptidase LdcA involved in peptidoglycan recycling
MPRIYPPQPQRIPAGTRFYGVGSIDAATNQPQLDRYYNSLMTEAAHADFFAAHSGLTVFRVRLLNEFNVMTFLGHDSMADFWARHGISPYHRDKAERTTRLALEAGFDGWMKTKVRTPEGALWVPNLNAFALEAPGVHRAPHMPIVEAAPAPRMPR